MSAEDRETIETQSRSSWSLVSLGAKGRGSVAGPEGLVAEDDAGCFGWLVASASQHLGLLWFCCFGHPAVSSYRFGVEGGVSFDDVDW